MKNANKYLVIVVIATLFSILWVCSSQYAAKHLGGTTTVDLPAGQKLINVTWKDNSLWYLTRPMTEEDKAETYTFQESSNLGVLEGTVTIYEYLANDDNGQYSQEK